MSGDTEREALANTLLDCCAVTRVGPDLWHPRDEIIDAILTEFLPEHDKRVRAEQRETDAQILDVRAEFEAPNARLAVEFAARMIRKASDSE